MKNLSILSIKIYQKYLSPYKGYKCAYYMLHKTDSCSASVVNIIEKKGVFKGWSNIKNQFNLCALAYEKIKEEDEKNKDKKKGGCHPADCLGCTPPSPVFHVKVLKNISTKLIGFNIRWH
ncbi:MAG: membrane protein insertion efficiency factor YidD [Gammaproteobacteria bacterium]|nr:membrane protein insertion efficiency factor YidD [Gammaproteobacteria bacterium]